MENTALKAFRKRNRLSQTDLAAYLGIGQPFLSQIEGGTRALPTEHLEKILANTEWDTSMLVNSGGNINSVVITGNDNHHNNIDNRHYYSDSPDVLRAQIELLDERIKEKDAQIKEKDAQIKSLLDIISKFNS